jgi:imidazolonepropionase-like amidohydrolase
VLAGPDLHPLEDATVLITDGVITAVGPDAEVELPAGAEVVDVTGHTVLPGLVDLHVHLGSPELAAGEQMAWWRRPELVADSVRFVPGTRRALLASGVTSVRSLGDDHAWVIEMRSLLRDGELEGPRLFAAGPLFTTRNGHPVVTLGADPASDAVRLPRSAEEARRMVRALAAGPTPVDLVKVVQERGSVDRPLSPLPPAVLRAVEEAHAHGLPVVAHWGSLDDLEDVLAAGVDGLEHLEARELLDGWPDGSLQTLVDRGIALDPTLAVTEVALHEEPHRALQQRAAEYAAAGGTLVVGSDAGMPGVPFGGGLHRELELLVEAGLPPQEALQAATVRAADVLRTDQIGVVAPGRAADLLVVDGAPHRYISAIRRVALVLRDGRTVAGHRAGPGS